MARERFFAVFGLGSFGREICRYLTDHGAAVVAVDKNAQLIDRIQDEVAQAILIDSTDEDSLADVPLEDVEAAVVAMGESVESSILTTAILKKIGVPRVIARAISEIHMRVLQQIGADEVVNLEIEEGRRVASHLLAGELLGTIPVSEDFSIAELYLPERFVGKTPKAIREELAVRVMAVRRGRTQVDDMGNPLQTQTVFLARDDEVLEERDIILVVGRNEEITRLRG